MLLRGFDSRLIEEDGHTRSREVVLTDTGSFYNNYIHTNGKLKVSTTQFQCSG